jgi:hypothetical protein
MPFGLSDAEMSKLIHTKSMVQITPESTTTITLRIRE